LKNVTIEQILVLIVFVLLPLLNWLLRRLGRRRERQPPLPPYMPEPRQRVSEPRSRAPQPARDRIQAREAPPVPAAVRRRGISTNSLFRTRAEMRRAIILMTILGPCRAGEASREREANM
jgi:integrase